MMSNTKFNSPAAYLTGLLVTLALTATQALALPTINLTAASYTGSDGNSVAAVASGTIAHTEGSVIFRRDSTQPAGTGVFNPFLRLDVKGNVHDEQGYNTSATITEGPANNQTTRKILDNMSPVNWTHDVLLSALQLVTVGSTEYYQFKLDINEPGADSNGASKSLLSLDGLKLYATGTPSQSAETLDSNGDIVNTAPGGSTGQLLWDMDKGKLKNTTGDGTKGTTNDVNDNSVVLDANAFGGPGSGRADMEMLVERKVIDAATGGKGYLVLWSRFGLTQGADSSSTTADAGFEEWSYSAKTGTGSCVSNCGGTSVPVPGTASLALVALGMLGYHRRTRKTSGVAV